MISHHDCGGRVGFILLAASLASSMSVKATTRPASSL
nr:MAG TPA: hypothetical protein [Caudoviricetes sp.]